MGLGEALARGLATAGWSLVIDARGEAELARAAGEIEAARPLVAAGTHPRLVAVPGDVNDPAHRAALIAAATSLGGLDLVVNNASSLGPTPLPPLTAFPLEGLRTALETNLVAPLALIQAAQPLLDAAAQPRVVNITSDAAVEAYPGWGGYGASKAALEHLSAVLAAENTAWRVWSVDPGDLRTRMHQDAFPGEDISDRPEPATVVPALIALITSDRPSGRVALSDVELVAAGSER
jgi:NAD(P)-dependent dehydrogenase (short-subunit alcohol dehydrogenase family)